MSKVVAVRKGVNDRIEEYKLDTGEILNHEEAVNAISRGEIEGVATFTTRDGGTGIRSNRGQYDYSLSELPEF